MSRICLYDADIRIMTIAMMKRIMRRWRSFTLYSDRISHICTCNLLCLCLFLINCHSRIVFCLLNSSISLSLSLSICQSIFRISLLILLLFKFSIVCSLLLSSILSLFHFCLVWLHILVYAYPPDHNDRTKGDRSTLSHVNLTKTALNVQLSARVALSDRLNWSLCNF